MNKKLIKNIKGGATVGGLAGAATSAATMLAGPTLQTMAGEASALASTTAGPALAAGVGMLAAGAVGGAIRHSMQEKKNRNLGRQFD
jgi:hypothetical protein